MQAIVYTSNTGFTARYAEAFAKKTGLTCYSWEEAVKNLASGTDIIYMGWLMAGGVKGLNKAKRAYNLQAVAAVGMQPIADDITPKITERYHLVDIPVFYLQGGYLPEKNKGAYKVMMGTMGKIVNAGVKKKDNPTEEEQKIADTFVSGADYWNEDNLLPLLQWFNA